MQLHEDWKNIVTCAWSMRFIVLSALIAGLHEGIQAADPSIDVHWMNKALVILTSLAGIARVLKQPEVTNAGS